MKFYRPKSILRLILTGFSLVALPLIIGLVYATISVDRLVSQSQHTLLQSVLATQGSQVLVEAITAMERNARQYQVLGDKVLFDVYEENHQKFVETARQPGIPGTGGQPAQPAGGLCILPRTSCTPRLAPIPMMPRILRRPCPGSPSSRKRRSRY